MTRGEIDPTIVYNSAVSSVADNASADVSRADVGFVVGSRPKFADETASLLRGRLRAAALAVILAAAFVGTIVNGTFSFLWLRMTILTMLAVCWIVRRSQRRLSLTHLRLIGVVVLQVAFMMHALLGRFAAEGDAASVIGAKYRFMAAWCALILVYGGFMPNTWRRCAVLMLPVALSRT